MSFVLQPVYVATVLCLLVALSEWLARRKFFSYLGSALIVILAAAVLANLRLLPSSQNAPPLYDGVFNFLAPLAIFFLLLDVKLKEPAPGGSADVADVRDRRGRHDDRFFCRLLPDRAAAARSRESVRGRGHVYRHLHRRERESERGCAAIRGDEKRHAIRRNQRRG